MADATDRIVGAELQLTAIGGTQPGCEHPDDDPGNLCVGREQILKGGVGEHEHRCRPWATIARGEFAENRTTVENL